MKPLFAAIAGAVVLSLAGCSETASTATNTEADVKSLKEADVQLNKAFDSKDSAKILAAYADDAVLMNPGSPAAKGKQAIGSALTAMVGDPAFALKFEADRVEVSKSGDMGYTQGHFTLAVTDPATKKPMQDHGSYVTVFKKGADGAWKAVSDIAVSEVPPPAPPADKK
jgi:uncharacterized protein (TIGR02246 family)